jgi:hypothetical protein
MSILKTYHQNNFFKHTFCQFQEVKDFDFPEKTHYKSKYNSKYFYTHEGVYRNSNHWGRVANCRWRLSSNSNYRNQKSVTGFAKWSDFFPLNESNKLFFIEIDFENKTAQIQPKKARSLQHLFTFSEAQKRVKKIHQLFKEDKWASYFGLEINELRQILFTAYTNSDKTLQQLKTEKL